MSHIAPSLAQEDKSKSTTWRYAVAGARDLRIDFMRGIALVMMVVAHTEVMSVFNIFSRAFRINHRRRGFCDSLRIYVGHAQPCSPAKVVLLTVSWGFISGRGKYIV